MCNHQKFWFIGLCALALGLGILITAIFPGCAMRDLSSWIFCAFLQSRFPLIQLHAGCWRKTDLYWKAFYSTVCINGGR